MCDAGDDMMPRETFKRLSTSLQVGKSACFHEGTILFPTWKSHAQGPSQGRVMQRCPMRLSGNLPDRWPLRVVSEDGRSSV